VDLPVNTDLPRDRARCACRAAFRRQVARRMSRLDLDVFFLGAAMIFYKVFKHSLRLYNPIEPMGRSLGRFPVNPFFCLDILPDLKGMGIPNHH
jgi:hypothetical protein